MSRAFVKDGDDKPGDELPDLPISPHPNYVTARGLAQLEERRAAAHAERAGLLKGDELANASHIARLDQEIRYFDARIGSAIPVDPAGIDHAEVHVGAAVTVRDGAGATHQYHVVGEDEADADAGLISWVSPLAKALMGARVGDRVVWRRPRGDVELDIIAIRYDDR